jgi:hypothetical protein
MAKTTFTEENIFNCKLDINLRKVLVKCCIVSIAFYGLETWTFQERDQKYLACFKCGAGQSS